MALDSNNNREFPAWIRIVIFALFVVHTFYAFAGDLPQADGKSVRNPQRKVHSPKLSGDIRISADKLISNRDDFTAEFSGNVLAAQAGVIIRSDHLFVYYKKAASAPSDKKDKDNPGSGRIRRIVAEGNVKINMSNKTAFCDRAVYNVAEGLITLSGNDVRISDADNYIHGRQITLNRLTGAISVSGGPEKRVEAVFRPGTEKMPVLPPPQKQE